MSTYKPTPTYHPDDKDILDFLHAAHPNERALQEFLAQRGIFVSPRARIDDSYAYISRLPLNWSQCDTLLALEKLRPRVEKWTHSDQKLDDDVPMSLLEEVALKVKELRVEKYSERHSVELLADGRLSIKVIYQDIKYEKTRLFQQHDEETEIIIEKIGSGFRFHRLDDGKSAEIETNLFGILEERLKEQKKELVSQKIRIEDLPTAKARVDFFLNLIRSIEGFEFDDLSSVKVGRMESGQGSESEEEDDPVAKAAASKYAAKIKSASFQGNNLLQAEEFQELLEEGFYIQSVSWSSKSDNPDIWRAYFQAGFKKGKSDSLLSYKVTGMRSLMEGVEDVKRRPAPTTQKALMGLLQNASAAVFDKFRTAEL